MRKPLFYRLVTQAVAVVLMLVLISARKHDVVTIFTVGDSTMADKSLKNDNQERGWGMMLAGWFDEQVRVDNHAVNGRSSKSFIDEGRWQKVLERIRPGDYVIIQFGHNDEKSDPKRHTVSGGSFDDNLRRFVREARERGAQPVLMNAVVRRNYLLVPPAGEDESLRQTAYKDYSGEEVDTLVDTHGDYIVAPRRVAREMGVPFIDANRITRDLENSLGKEGSRKLHMNFKPGEHPSLPDGRGDDTHYRVQGARRVSGLLAEALCEQVPALKRHLRHYDLVVSSEGRGDFFTVQQAYDAVPTDRKTTILVGNGEWEKPAKVKGKRVKYVLRSGARWK
ncbi:MAG: pectin esterase [Prevotella sp.]|nr:pectin esterase [Prevotella sp.]